MYWPYSLNARKLTSPFPYPLRWILPGLVARISSGLALLLGQPDGRASLEVGSGFALLLYDVSLYCDTLESWGLVDPAGTAPPRLSQSRDGKGPTCDCAFPIQTSQSRALTPAPPLSGCLSKILSRRPCTRGLPQRQVPDN